MVCKITSPHWVTFLECCYFITHVRKCVIKLLGNMNYLAISFDKYFAYLISDLKSQGRLCYINLRYSPVQINDGLFVKRVNFGDTGDWKIQYLGIRG